MGSIESIYIYTHNCIYNNYIFVIIYNYYIFYFYTIYNNYNIYICLYIIISIIISLSSHLSDWDLNSGFLTCKILSIRSPYPRTLGIHLFTHFFSFLNHLF